MRERFLQFLEQQDLNANKLATLVNVPPTTLRDYINGQSKTMNMNNWIAIANKFGLSLDWVFLGVGNMYIKDNIKPEEQAEGKEENTDKAKNIEAIYDSLRQRDITINNLCDTINKQAEVLKTITEKNYELISKIEKNHL